METNTQGVYTKGILAHAQKSHRPGSHYIILTGIEVVKNNDPGFKAGQIGHLVSKLVSASEAGLGWWADTVVHA